MIRLNVPCSLDYRDLAMRLVAAACKLVQAQRRDERTGALVPDDDFDNHVISAFGEAFNNAVLHGNCPPGSELGVEIEHAAGRMTIRLVDHGTSFDFAAVSPPELDALPESGMGIFIIRSCMHDVSYRPGPPNVLTMTRYDGQGTQP
jgi:serine/threonine-protein kinase RsbW